LGRRVAGIAVALAATAAVVSYAVAARGTGTSSTATAVGAYRLPDGSVVAVVPRVGGLRVVDYATGALRNLESGTLDTPDARRIPLRVLPASFADGRVRLAGRLLVPQGAGPFPAVVVVPGSIKATRESYDLWAYFFATRGFAVLSYDKRGVGASTGKYTSEPSKGNIKNLAADAVAAVAWLRTRANVDPARIGLSGGSQAGWVIPLAASRSRGVAFATIQSGPAMSVGRQRAYALLTHEGALEPPPSEADVQSALAAQPDAGFDPRPALTALRIPVLWQLGAVDKRQYTPETVANLDAIASPSFTVRVYPRGAHSLRDTANGLQSEEATSPGFVAGLFGDLAAWLDVNAGK